MPRPTAPATSAPMLRMAGFAVAIALGAVAIWLIVTSSSQKHLEIGILCGLWGLLLGAFALFGRRQAFDADVAAAVVSAVQSHLDHTDVPVGAELELRSRATEVESARDVADRRAYEARLESMLRQEIREAVNREVGTLRAEITQLRTELLEKVGGQLRLEHIETTRVIGSDLEALQDEIRALKTAARSPLDAGRTARASVNAAILDATVVEREVVERAVVDRPHQRSGPGAVSEPARRVDEPRPADRGRPAASSVPPGPVPPASAPSVPAQASRRPAENRAPEASAPDGRPGDLTGPIAATPPVSAARPVAAAQSPARTTPGPMQAPAGGPRADQPAQAQQSPQAPQPRQSAPAEPPQRATTGPSASAGSSSSGATDGSSALKHDPFADLPRLSPFVDDGPALPPAPRTSTEPTYVRPPAAPPEPPRYEGRRRRMDEAAAVENGAGHESSGRRRRVEDEEASSLLAELLDRERHG